MSLRELSTIRSTAASSAAVATGRTTTADTETVATISCTTVITASTESLLTTSEDTGTTAVRVSDLMTTANTAYAIGTTNGSVAVTTNDTAVVVVDSETAALVAPELIAMPTTYDRFCSVMCKPAEVHANQEITELGKIQYSDMCVAKSSGLADLSASSHGSARYNDAVADGEANVCNADYESLFILVQPVMMFMSAELVITIHC